MPGGWDKFRLLIWKNWVLQKRHKVQTAVEILAPVIFATLMVLVRSLVEPKITDKIGFESFSAARIKLPTEKSYGSDGFEFAYSPKVNMTYDAVRDAVGYLIQEVPVFGSFIDSSFINLKGFENADEMFNYLNDPSNTKSYCGIQFDDSLVNMTSWPDDVSLTLRFPAQLRSILPGNAYFNWKTNFLFPIFQTPGPRSPGENYGGWPSYVREHFLPLSHALMRQVTLAKMLSDTQGNDTQGYDTIKFPEVCLQRFPHPAFLKDDLLPALQNFTSIIIMLSFVYSCINTVKVIATEKERQLKEVMKIMGLPNWLHWTAWFIKAFSYLMIAVILIVILIKVEWYTTEYDITGYSVLTYTPWHVLLVFLMIFMMSSVCFCFMISVFFSKANTAATIAGALWFLSYAPYSFLLSDRVLPSLSSRMAACLASNTAMAFGFNIIIANEATAEGLQWSKMFTPLTNDDPFVMGHVFIMLVVDALLYLLVALYVEQVFPGSYGVAQRWYFPASPSFWRSVFKTTAVVEDIPQENPTLSDSIEPDPKGLPIGINIINLTKVYSKKRIAVDKLNLKVFEDQITVLLGHNGAGKTTTMSMLTGMFPPTSGTATVAGHDIRTEVAKVRESLGLCPQHNVLFSDLTVAEHVAFYARLKGVSSNELKEQVDKYITLLGLEKKRNVLAGALSGGMKRRLSVGAALCGGSRVVLLDEPTSGMDPAARRHLWDLLHQEKKGRTIILTTHFMDEAEVLGDRVAILAGGQLRAVGSPFYLKKRFGDGYRLTATRHPTTPAAPVTALIRSHIPSARLYSDIGSELSYVLPDELSKQFEPMLRDLETRQKELGLESYGISATNLEDVFMKVGADAVEVVNDQDHISYRESDTNGTFVEHLDSYKNGDITEISADSATVLHTGRRLYLNQWKALLIKKFIAAKRTWILGLLQIFIPILFLIIAILVSRMYQNSKDLPSRDLALANGYEDSVTIMHQSQNISSDMPNIIEKYQNYFDVANISTMIYRNVTAPINDSYLDEAVRNMPEMRRRYHIGVSFEFNKIIAWFSNFPHHDVPASVLLVHNAIVKSFFPNSSFSLFNHPLPFTLKTKFQMLSFGDSTGFQIAFNVGFSMAFASSFFILFYVKENACRSKLLQYASGASPTILWGASFLWDILTFLIITLGLLITLISFNQSSFSKADELGRFFLLMMIYAWSMLPVCYLASPFFHTPSTGFARMCLFNIITGVAMFLVVEVMNAPGLDLEHIGNILHWIFLLSPNYALSAGLKNLYDASVTLKICNQYCEINNSAPVPLLEECTREKLCHSQLSDTSFCCISDYPYFEWSKPGIGAHLTYMSLVGLFLFCLLLAIEYKISTMIWHTRHVPPPALVLEDEDPDVLKERAHVDGLSRDQYGDYNLLLKDLSKYYGKFLAVNQVSLGIKGNECFGLLGINGAGKTTTFKMLTGDLTVSSGSAWVSGLSVNSDMKNVYRSIGYCPQFDALLEEMTGRETLQMFSRLRGIPRSRQEFYMRDLSRRLGFVKHLDKKVREYSGGNKRKLSTAIALLGDPQVVYLDEPTTGMDPMAKRQVWRSVAGQRCVVLTSHSMEECEALCSRLAIMVNGRPCCLGSPQHLKSKFSQGYTLIVKLRRLTLQAASSARVTPDLLGATGSATVSLFDSAPLHHFLTDRFIGAQLKETYQGLFTYYLPDVTIPWSTVFGVMEGVKDALDIEDYSIGQTSLEQIFLQFTKDQKAHKDD